ncbi:methyltransferase domain-containing protein [Kitasatospora sp. NPDC051853]|uniref:methyltransferase domain-containing protein n=1 Tax=Kitasatospora sp. NPDC051853 TaxID=3364058 RepID=UPI0037A61DDE
MSEVRSYERSLLRSREALTRKDRPKTFTLSGREWDLLPEVFAPVYSPSTATALELLGLGGAAGSGEGSFLEIGCGTGVIAVAAALAGHRPVVAADINARAVQNAELNAARHGVAGTVRAVHSDLFDALGPAERFDTVFWSSNYVLAPEGYRYASVHERAYVDPGYAAHRRYLAQAPARLAPGGRALLHFSDRGDLAGLHRIAAELGRTVRVVAHREVSEGGLPVGHQLLEIG